MADTPEQKKEEKGQDAQQAEPLHKGVVKKEEGQECTFQTLCTEVQKKRIVEQKSEAAPPSNHKRNQKLWLFTGFLFILGIGFLLLWVFYLQYHESTDDAYSNGNMINVNAAVSGSVVAFYADDTDFVTEGQLLVELDTTDYQVAYEKELQTLASTVLQVRQIYDNVPVNIQNIENARIALATAAYDYNDRLHLVGTGAISKEDFVHAKDAFLQAEVTLKQTEYQLQVALDARGNTAIEEHPLILQQKANVVNAYYNLNHCKIFAPATGYVAQRSVEVGQWLTPYTNVNLMAIIPTDYVWVDANYKETQLTYMRVGQPATVTFDMYGSDVVYKGKVLGIASGSGSVFSLIPPQNATGNWIKIVQRLPVRISLDPEVVKKFPVRIGISAEVDVDITNQNLPRLQEMPKINTVGKTCVFDIDLEQVNKIMQKIISENLTNQRN